MRASFISLLVTSLALASTLPVEAGGKKRPRKQPKKAPATTPAPAPEPAPTPAEPVTRDGLGDPAAAPPPDNALADPAAPAPSATPAPTPAPAPAKPLTAARVKANKARAKTLQGEATKLYNIQKYVEAADLYQQAYLLDSNPAYLYASAQSQRLAGDCAKALLSYQAYLRANPPDRSKAEANVTRCEQELRDREAAVSAEALAVPYDVPAPPPPPPEDKVLPPPPPPPPPEKSYLLGHAMLGVGVIAIGAGGYLFYTGRKTLDDHNNAASYDAYIATLGDVDGAKQKQKLGLLAVGGGAALVTGAILFYVIHSGSDSQAEQAPVGATVSAHGATVTLTGSF